MAWVAAAVGVLAAALWMGQRGSPSLSSAMAGDPVPRITQQKWEYARLRVDTGIKLWLPDGYCDTYASAVTRLGGVPAESYWPETATLEIMNRLGDQGWELVSATRVIDRNGDGNAAYCLKRAK